MNLIKMTVPLAVALLTAVPAQAQTLVCKRIPLIAETFLPCEETTDGAHGGESLCGSEKNVISYISELQVDLGESNEALSTTASFIDENEVLEAPCTSAGLGLAGQRCQFKNGVVVDLVSSGLGSYSLYVFAKEANSPSYVARSGEECQLVD